MTERYSGDVLKFTTGGEEELEILRQRDAFFKGVLLGLGFDEEQLDGVGAEVAESGLGREQPSGFDPTDDRLHRLVLHDEVLAIVFDRRNDSNYHEVTFWSRLPSEMLTNVIQTMHSQ